MADTTEHKPATGTAPDTGAQPLLETSGLTKSFGGLLAVDHVNYRLPTDEIHCLIGPNGAGKSTFFKLLTGRLRPDEGMIRFRGRDITDLYSHERAQLGISLKFQELSVYPELSVKENLRIPAQQADRELRPWIEELLGTVNLVERQDLAADDLSHGEQQWLEIAMSVAIDPELLLLDEPTAGMTIQETKQTGDLIESLVDRGVSVLVVEHDINLVRQIAQRVTVLHNGSVFAEGSVEEIESNEAVQRIYLGQSAEES